MSTRTIRSATRGKPLAAGWRFTIPQGGWFTRGSVPIHLWKFSSRVLLFFRKPQARLLKEVVPIHPLVLSGGDLRSLRPIYRVQSTASNSSQQSKLNRRKISYLFKRWCSTAAAFYLFGNLLDDYSRRPECRG